MATTTKFAVHSFQINIDVGDSAIHLLVDDTTRPKPTVYRAVYIDGGKSGETPYSRTTSVIREIQTVYTPDPGGHFDLFGDAADNNWLRFDAIIVTHFDDDHYGGVQFLINDGFLVMAKPEAEKLRLEVQNAMATKPWPPAKKDQAEWIKDNDAVAKALAGTYYAQNRYMKYKTIVAGFADPPADTDELLTTLYLPYMSTDKGGNPKTKFFSSESYPYLHLRLCMQACGKSRGIHRRRCIRWLGAYRRKVAGHHESGTAREGMEFTTCGWAEDVYCRRPSISSREQTSTGHCCKLRGHEKGPVCAGYSCIVCRGSSPSSG
jgi:hypothetical protein